MGGAHVDPRPRRAAGRSPAAARRALPEAEVNEGRPYIPLADQAESPPPPHTERKKRKKNPPPPQETPPKKKKKKTASAMPSPEFRNWTARGRPLEAASIIRRVKGSFVVIGAPRTLAYCGPAPAAGARSPRPCSRPGSGRAAPAHRAAALDPRRQSSVCRTRGSSGVHVLHLLATPTLPSDRRTGPFKPRRDSSAFISKSRLAEITGSWREAGRRTGASRTGV